jgi:hypothetical protein
MCPSSHEHSPRYRTARIQENYHVLFIHQNAVACRPRSDTKSVAHDACVLYRQVQTL